MLLWFGFGEGELLGKGKLWWVVFEFGSYKKIGWWVGLWLIGIGIIIL